MTDLLIGQTINGKFRVGDAIGRGGMGSVYRAEQLALGRVVALKVLRNRPGTADMDPAFQRRFFLEASLCAKMSHPNIVTIYDYGKIEGVADDAYFIAMELIDGETLHTRLRARGGSLDVGESVHVALGMARGLREAHRHGIVHRDLKPGNVMLVPGEDGNENVKILDFGLVKQVGGTDGEDLTQEGSFLGSPKYMSPEQIDHVAVDHRADLYALGVILYQCLVGRVPFDAPTSMQILLAHVSLSVPPVREVNPSVEIPAPLEAVMLRLLSKDPAARHANADELIRELRALQSSFGGRPTAADLSSPTGKFTADVAPLDPSGSLSAASLAGHSAVQATNGRQRSLTVPVVAALATVAVLVAGGVWVRTTQSVDARPRQPIATPAHATPAVDAMVVRAVPRLYIDSTPPGATVTESGRTFGTTPLAVEIDPAMHDARHLVVTLAGYQPFALDAPSIAADAHAVATLVALPPAAPVVARDAGASATPASRASARAHAPPTRQATHRAPLDIIDAR